MRDLFKYLNKTLISERVDEDDETVKTDAWFWLKEEMFVKCDE